MLLREYWIVFKNTEKWWGCLLREGFSHMIVVYRDYDGFWKIFNPREQILDESFAFASKVEENDCDFPRLIAKSGFQVVKIIKNEKNLGFPKIRWYHVHTGLFFNCMTMCRYFMSINVSGGTPYRFYKKLMYLSHQSHSIERYHHGIDSIHFL